MPNGILRTVIEAAKRISGLGLAALTVLSASRDPYRLDTEAGNRIGAWLAAEITRLGVKLPIHLRGLHYVLVALGNVLKPNGAVYTNTDEDWVWLSETAAKAARYLGHLPFELIIDARNESPQNFMPDAADDGTWVSVGLSIEVPAAADLVPQPHIVHAVRQPNLIALFGEKSSLREVLLPVAQEVGGILCLPTGEPSDSMVHQIAAAAATAARPLVILYFADFDPSGWQMPVSVARKLQALRDLHFPDLEFKVLPVGLTREQCIQFDLPSTPLKDNERRADGWRRKWGREQTEIDAMVALHPGELRRIAREAVAPFVDDTLEERYAEAMTAWREKGRAAILAQLDPDKRELIQSVAAEKLAELQEQIAELEEACRLDPDEFDLPEFVPPEPILPDGPEPEALCNSASDWTDATLKLIERKSYASDPGSGR